MLKLCDLGRQALTDVLDQSPRTLGDFAKGRGDTPDILADRRLERLHHEFVGAEADSTYRIDDRHTQPGGDEGAYRFRELRLEDNASRHCIEMLTPYSQENGGPLKIEHITYVEGRGNLIITYPGKTDKTVGFVGSHLDVVPADPETWDFNPFELTVDGDKLLGRGTTDCLGHIALVTEFFLQLAQAKPDLDVTVCAVFIASEEAASVPKDAGVEGLVEHGRIAHLKNGPIIWVDCADSQPCIGTAGAMQWHLEVTGKLFHSGLPHKGINSLELGMEVQDHIGSSEFGAEEESLGLDGVLAEEPRARAGLTRLGQPVEPLQDVPTNGDYGIEPLADGGEDVYDVEQPVSAGFSEEEASGDAPIEDESTLHLIEALPEAAHQDAIRGPIGQMTVAIGDRRAAVLGGRRRLRPGPSRSPSSRRGPR